MRLTPAAARISANWSATVLMALLPPSSFSPVDSRLEDATSSAIPVRVKSPTFADFEPRALLYEIESIGHAAQRRRVSNLHFPHELDRWTINATAAVGSASLIVFTFEAGC